MKIFRSPCCIQIPSRPVSCTGGWVQLIAKKEILIVVSSLVVHCWAIRNNVIVAWQLYDVADVQFTVEKEGPLNFAAVLPTLRFSSEFGLVPLWICVFFKTGVLLALSLFWLKLACFADFVCGLLKFYGTFAVSIYCKRKFGRVFV